MATVAAAMAEAAAVTAPVTVAAAMAEAAAVIGSDMGVVAAQLPNTESSPNGSQTRRKTT